MVTCEAAGDFVGHLRRQRQAIGDGPPVDHVQEGVVQQHEASPARVDHTGLREDRQQVGCAPKRRDGGFPGRLEYLQQIPAAVLVDPSRGCGRVGRDGQHRAFDGTHDPGSRRGAAFC